MNNINKFIEIFLVLRIGVNTILHPKRPVVHIFADYYDAFLYLCHFKTKKKIVILPNLSCERNYQGLYSIS